MIDLTYCEPKVGIIRPSHHGDCLSVGANLREQDALERWNYDRMLPVEGVTDSFNRSSIAMTIEKDGVPIAMFGVIEKPEPTLWLCPTDKLNTISRIFVRNTRQWIDKMLSHYPYLVAYVDVRNTESLRWIKFVGGKLVDTIFMGRDDLPFRKFEFKRKELIARDNILSIEKKMAKHPLALFGDCFPLKHKFADGLYIREIFLPKGYVIVTKLFKQSHATFMLLGDCSILTEKGIMRVKAPFHMVTSIGTKRVIYVHEDTVWITIHANPKGLRDPKALEEDIIAKDYKELDEQENKFIEVFSEEKKCHLQQ